MMMMTSHAVSVIGRMFNAHQYIASIYILYVIIITWYINRFKSEEGFRMSDKCDSFARIDVVKKLVNCANEIPSDGIFGSKD